MNRFSTLALIIAGATFAIAAPRIGHAQSTYTGTVERVWEDGFRLQTGERALRVDSWDVYGDSTASNLEVGDQVTITGEFSGREFDAFSADIEGGENISQSTYTQTNGQGDNVPQPTYASTPQGGNAQSTYTGTVERIWEDGFRLQTGERALRVDSWDVYGDNTARYIDVGDRVTITGEFGGRDFDAFSITDAE